MTLGPGSVINGTLLGRGNDAFQFGGTGSDRFNVGTIGTTQQHQGFATFTKTGISSWTLTGSGTQNWTIQSRPGRGSPLRAAELCTLGTGLRQLGPLRLRPQCREPRAAEGASLRRRCTPEPRLERGVAHRRRRRLHQDNISVKDRVSSGMLESLFGAIYGGTIFGALDLNQGRRSHRRRQQLDASLHHLPGLLGCGNVRSRPLHGPALLRGRLQDQPLRREPRRPRLAARHARARHRRGPDPSASRWIHREWRPDGAHRFGPRRRSRDGDLGAAGEVTLPTSFPLTASALVGWRHAYGDVTPTALVAFRGSASPFTVAAVPVDRDAFLAEAGLGWAVSPNFSLDVSYSGQYGERGRDNAVKAKLEARF